MAAPLLQLTDDAGAPEQLMDMPQSRYWWDLSTREFAALDLERFVAILPIGAVEQHGPHLPVRVDAAINDAIVSRAVEIMPPALPALILPALPYGKSDEHIAYKGTLHVPHDVLGRLWIEIARSVHRAGVRRILFWNSHGGQPQLMEIVCRQARIELGMLAVGASWFRVIDTADLYSDEERQHGIHGGESETSVMLHIHPTLVKMDHAADFRSRSIDMAAGGRLLAPEGGVSFGWQAQDLHPAGVMGNAAAADASRGRQEVERAARALVRLVQEVAEYPLSQLIETTSFDKL